MESTQTFYTLNKVNLANFYNICFFHRQNPKILRNLYNERVCAKSLKSQSASILMIVKSQSEASVNPQSELKKMGLDMGMCDDNAM